MKNLDNRFCKMQQMESIWLESVAPSRLQKLHTGDHAQCITRDEVIPGFIMRPKSSKVGVLKLMDLQEACTQISVTVATSHECWCRSVNNTEENPIIKLNHRTIKLSCD